ncbi:hypothetical protein BDV95DRAFT_43178 [Massariosphaeria phaeospora]|uniref:Uncharacterized protein n=1 Tax=Massariosphaeria phaeospora TaxID=100035 RepID=A0A7C8IAN3_9PLEO|nr:hypothetical protein BDV95DRAFT_43178 [Massariosphaeria phaeospora]
MPRRYCGGTSPGQSISVRARRPRHILVSAEFPAQRDRTDPCKDKPDARVWGVAAETLSSGIQHSAIAFKQPCIGSVQMQAHVSSYLGAVEPTPRAHCRIMYIYFLYVRMVRHDLADLNIRIHSPDCRIQKE